MQKRSLRIVKRVRNTPVRGICESCNMEFFADPHNLGQAAIQQQFNAHKCQSGEADQKPARTVGGAATAKNK